MARPCSFKVGDKVGMKRGDGSTVHPEFTGTVQNVHGGANPSERSGFYDCRYVVRRDDGSSFEAGENDLKRVT
jgi:hypothetical protein